MPDYFNTLDLPYGIDTSNLLTVGEETYGRDLSSNAGNTAITGALRLSYFTARKTETTTQCRFISGTTAAGATPTLVRYGLYLIAANGDGTLVASTPNDTSLFAGTLTPYPKSWLVAYNKVAGRRYAAGVLVVTAAASPTLVGVAIQGTAEAATAPRICGSLAGQSDLPNSFTDASLTAIGARFYAAILP